jgi:hypothetical protein
MAAGLYLRIFKRQSGGKGKRVSFDGWGKEPPSSLNLAPTKGGMIPFWELSITI